MAKALYVEPMIQAYAEQGDLKAAELLRMLLVFANDPTRAAHREVRRKLRHRPAAGVAAPPDGYDGQCFWIVRTDGSRVAFSYKHCLEARPSDT